MCCTILATFSCAQFFIWLFYFVRIRDRVSYCLSMVYAFPACGYAPMPFRVPVLCSGI